MQRDQMSRTSQAIAVFLIAALLAATVVFVAFLLIDQGKRTPITISSMEDASITVEITGEIRTPGVYTLPWDARLNDLVLQAGGLTVSADVRNLNMAQHLADGTSVTIPSNALQASPASTNGKISLNTASEAELNTLPGIGDVLAGRIVAYRERFGPFESIDQLIEVEGISAATIEELRPLVTIDG